MDNSIKKEEIIFLFDLLTDYLKRRTIIKSIQHFIQEKNKYSLSNPCSYGIVIFQKEANPVHMYDKHDDELIVDYLTKAWETRETEKSYFENGLFEILSYIFRKGRKERKIYRIIIISDTPSKRSDDYYNAAYDLIIKARNFDTYIDIIRVGDASFYEDDIKLKIITSESNGGLFYCDYKQFNDVLSSLIHAKREFQIIKSREEDIECLEEDRIFYEKLAVDLISLDKDDEHICSICQSEICPICELNSDEIRKCYNCSAKFHSCCIGEYAISHNIGFKHIFRCPNCDTLLKVDKELIDILDTESSESQIAGTVEVEKSKKISDETAIANNEKSLESLPEKSAAIEEEREVKIGVFGPKIKVRGNKKLKIINLEEQGGNIEDKTRKSIASLKPPQRKSNFIKICPICGASNAATSPNCTNCGYKLS